MFSNLTTWESVFKKLRFGRTKTQWTVRLKPGEKDVFSNVFGLV